MRQWARVGGAVAPSYASDVVMSVARPARAAARCRALSRDNDELPCGGWIAQAGLAESGWGRGVDPEKTVVDPEKTVDVANGLGEQ